MYLAPPPLPRLKAFRCPMQALSLWAKVQMSFQGVPSYQRPCRHCQQLLRMRKTSLLIDFLMVMCSGVVLLSMFQASAPSWLFAFVIGYPLLMLVLATALWPFEAAE